MGILEKMKQEIDELQKSQDLLITDEDVVSLFKNLKTEWISVSTNFTNMLIPFSLPAITCSGLTKIQEDETEEIMQDYEKLEGNITNAIRISSTIVRRLKSTIQGKKAAFTSDNVRSVVELYEKVYLGVKQNAANETKITFKHIQDAYLGFMTIARLINTCLQEYGIKFPDATIGRITGLPDLQYPDSNGDLTIFLTNFVSSTL